MKRVDVFLSRVIRLTYPLLFLYLFLGLNLAACKSKGKINLSLPSSSSPSLFKDELSSIPPVEIGEDKPGMVSVQIPVSTNTSVGSGESNANDNLVCSDILRVESSDNSLIDAAQVIISKAEGKCLISFSVVKNANGNAILRIVNINNPDDFVEVPVKVNAVNDPPTLASHSPSISNEDMTGEIKISILDDNSGLTCAESISAVSDNENLIKNANISVSGEYPECLLTYVPETNQSGSAQVTVTVFDGEFQTSMTYSVSVLSTDDPALISAIADQLSSEGVPIINVPITIVDTDSTQSCASLVAKSSNTDLISSNRITISGSSPNCLLSLNPNTDASGSSLITIDLVVGGVSQAIKEFSLNITPVNDPPTDITVTSSSVAENSGINFLVGNLLAVDVDANDSYSYELVTGAGDTHNGLFNIVGNQLRLNHSADFESATSYSVRIKVTDGGGLSLEKNLTVQVTNVNEAPDLALIPDQITSEDAAPISIALNASDIDSALDCTGSFFSYSSSNPHLVAATGGVSFSGTWPSCFAAISTLPDAFGNGQITVSVSDGSLLASATFQLSVSAVNDAPQLTAIATQTMLEDGGSTVVNFSISDIDSTVACNSVSVSSNLTNLIDNGQMILGGGTSKDCSLALTPKQDQSGSATITLMLSDGSSSGNDSVSETFTLNVTAVNDLPSITAIAPQILSEDTPSPSVAFTISDVESTVHCSAVTVGSSNPSLFSASGIQISGGLSQNCALILSPSLHSHGSAEITLSISDGTSSQSQTFLATVSQVNDIPTIGLIANQTIDEDNATVALNFDIYDVESTLSCTDLTKSSDNTTIIKASGILVTGGSSSPGVLTSCQVVVTPEANQFGGPVTVTLTVSDGTAVIDRTFTVTVNSVNDAPSPVTVGGITYAINEDDTNVSLQLGSYTDVESVQSSLNYKIITSPTLGVIGSLPAVAASGTASLTYAPNANINGSDSLVYQVCDGPNGTGVCTSNISVAISIAAVNDAPVLATIADQTTHLNTPTSAFNVIVSDVDGPAQSCSASFLSYSSASTSVVAATDAVTWGGAWPNCTAVITPITGGSGSSVISFTVSDGTAVSAAKSFTLTVNAIPTGWYQEAYLKAGNAEANDLFGSSVSIFGDTTIIGATNENSQARTIINGGGWDPGNGDGLPSGAAYVFTRSEGTWSQQAYIKSPNSYLGHKFGTSVGLSQDRAVVSSPGEGASQGAAYVFNRTGTIWSQEANIWANLPSTSDLFGQKLALSGDTLIVGATGEDSSQTTITNGTATSSDESFNSSGAAYVYRKVSSTWTQEAYIKAVNSRSSLNFGSSVAVSGDTAVVGAPSESSSQTTITNGTTASTDNSNTLGAAYIYKRTGHVWGQQAYMKASNGNAGDSYGVAVALSGDVAVIGAKGEASNVATVTNGTTSSTDNSIGAAGASYVYKRTGNNWAQTAFLKPANPNSADYFGENLAISGSSIVVGAIGEASLQTTITNGVTASTDNSISQAGAVYVFKQTSSAWAQEAYLKASNAQGSDNFGNAVAMAGDTVLVGAYNEDSSQTTITNGTGASTNNTASSAGAVYVYRNRARPFDPYFAAVSSTTSSFTVNWTGENLGSANGNFKVVYSTVTPGANCSSGTVAYTGTSTSATISSGLTPGQTYHIRICAFDGTSYSEGILTQVTIKGDDVNPSIVSIRRGSTTNPVPQGTASLDYVITFSENVIGGGTDNFQLVEVNTTSGASGKLTSVSCSGTTCTVTASPLNLGELRLDLVSSTGIVDLWGNPLTSTRTGDETYTLVNGWFGEAYLKASNTDANDFFGSVDLSSDLAIVGAYGESSSQVTITNDSTSSTDNSASQAGAGYIFQRTGTTWAQQAYLKASNANSGDNFGHAVAISGNTAIVGAPSEKSSQATIINGLTASTDNSVTGAGAAYIFTQSGSTWSQQAYLKASNPNTNDLFGGHSLALSGDTAVVGARNEASSQVTITNGTTSSTDNSFASAGAAYVFRRVGTQWAQEAYVKASNAQASNWFGDAVSISGDTMVIGAYGEASSQVTITNGATSGSNTGLSYSGAAYVYQRTGSNWSQESFIKASNANINDKFGDAVSLSGSTLVVGAPQEASNLTTITNGTTSSSDNTKGNSGAAYIYTRTSGAWAQESYIKASNTDVSDFFGCSVNISGNHLIVEALGEDSSQTGISNHSSSSIDNLKLNSGARFIYRRSGSSWTQEAYIKASNSDASDADVPNLGDPYLGLVSISGDTALVGVLNEDSSQTTITNGVTASADNSASKSGAVYVYRNTTQIFDPELYVTSKSTTSITLSWGSNLGKTNRVKISPAASGSNTPASCSDPLAIALAAGVNTYTYTGLNSASKYSFRVCGFDGTNVSSGSIIRESTD